MCIRQNNNVNYNFLNALVDFDGDMRMKEGRENKCVQKTENKNADAQ